MVFVDVGHRRGRLDHQHGAIVAANAVVNIDVGTCNHIVAVDASCT